MLTINMRDTVILTNNYFPVTDDRLQENNGQLLMDCIIFLFPSVVLHPCP